MEKVHGCFGIRGRPLRTILNNLVWFSIFFHFLAFHLVKFCWRHRDIYLLTLLGTIIVQQNHFPPGKFSFSFPSNVKHDGYRLFIPRFKTHFFGRSCGEYHSYSCSLTFVYSTSPYCFAFTLSLDFTIYIDSSDIIWWNNCLVSNLVSLYIYIYYIMHSVELPFFL